MPIVVFVIFILTPFLLEALGIAGIRQYVPFFYLVVPMSLGFLIKKRIRFPIKTTITYGIFILSLFISALWFSVDRQTSFELAIFYLSLFLIFVFFYNHRIEEKEVWYGLVWVGGVLAGFKNFLPPPQTEYQMVYPLFGNHNHLGDLLGLIIIGCFYFFIKSKKNAFLLVSIIGAPLFFLSFSRSAYIASLVVLFFLYFLEKGIKHSYLAKATITIFSIGMIMFLVITAKEAGKSPVFRQLYGVFSEKLSLQQKDFFGGRFSYFQQAIESLYERPFFGLGLGNFEYASKKYAARYYETTTDAHNIFLELGVEGGVFALIPFALFIFFLLKNGLQNRSLFFFFFLYLLLNFQTDYTYKIYGLMVLFMVFAGNSYSEEKEWKADWLFGLLSALCYLVFFVIIVSNLLLVLGEHQYSLMVYPFNKQAYKSKTTTLKSAEKLEQIAPYHISTISFLSDFYSGLGKKQKALELLERLYSLNKFVSFDIIKKMYFFKKETQSAKEAERFLHGVLTGYNEISYLTRGRFEQELHAFCLKVRGKRCSEINY